LSSLYIHHTSKQPTSRSVLLHSLINREKKLENQQFGRYPQRNLVMEWINWEMTTPTHFGNQMAHNLIISTFSSSKKCEFKKFAYNWISNKMKVIHQIESQSEQEQISKTWRLFSHYYLEEVLFADLKEPCGWFIFPLRTKLLSGNEK
jgi:hypothetical protein